MENILAIDIGRARWSQEDLLGSFSPISLGSLMSCITKCHASPGLFKWGQRFEKSSSALFHGPPRVMNQGLARPGVDLVDVENSLRVLFSAKNLGGRIRNGGIQWRKKPHQVPMLCDIASRCLFFLICLVDVGGSIFDFQYFQIHFGG